MTNVQCVFTIYSIINLHLLLCLVLTSASPPPRPFSSLQRPRHLTFSSFLRLLIPVSLSHEYACHPVWSRHRPLGVNDST